MFVVSSSSSNICMQFDVTLGTSHADIALKIWANFREL